MNSLIVLSHFQVGPILKSQKKGDDTVVASTDLGLTQTEVKLNRTGALFPNGRKVGWKDLNKVYKHKNRCYVVDDNDSVSPVVVYSEKTKWVRSLYPTQEAPTTLVSGILMHRIKGIDPLEDTRRKVKSLGPLSRAVVLDTATGLGYTAIEAARQAKQVVTVELDQAAIEIAKLNPWSRELFSNHKIIMVIGNLLEEVKRFNSSRFSHIIHDPPTLKLAGELYSGEMYRDFYRILQIRGKLFHYVGDPESKHGSMVTKGVVTRLKEAGFSNVERRPESFGVLAMK